MKDIDRYAIISTDNNPEYYKLIPLCAYAWRQLEIEPVLLTVNVPYDKLKIILHYSGIKIHKAFPGVEGVKDATVAQLARLFAHEYFADDAVLITGDADMIQAKDIFTNEGDIVSYGYDLTGRSEIPICYVMASAAKWRQLVGGFTVPESAKSEKWETYWSTDQQYLTQRARAYGMNRIKFIDRGNNNRHGLPTGRWDRHDWTNIPEDIIDVHMKRNDWSAQYEVMQRLFPNADRSFIDKFKEEVE